MAHAEQKFFIAHLKRFLPEWFKEKMVLEVGSLNINGSVREHFEDCHYVGIDVGEGPCVDAVAGGERFPGKTGTFDVVISCEAMEHNPYWRETFLNALRMLRPDGLMLITCAGYGRRRHGTRDSSPTDSPLTVANGWDYYRNLGEADFRELGNFDRWFAWHRFFSDHVSRDLYFAGLGPAVKDGRPVAEACAAELDYFLRMKNVFGAY